MTPPYSTILPVFLRSAKVKTPDVSQNSRGNIEGAVRRRRNESKIKLQLCSLKSNSKITMPHRDT